MSARVSRLYKISNTTVKSRTISFGRIQRRQPKWFGHVLTIDDKCWLKMVYQWTPHSWRGGRSQKSWKNQMTDLMRSRTLLEAMTGNRYIQLLGIGRWLIDVQFLSMDSFDVLVGEETHALNNILQQDETFFHVKSPYCYYCVPTAHNRCARVENFETLPYLSMWYTTRDDTLHDPYILLGECRIFILYAHDGSQL